MLQFSIPLFFCYANNTAFTDCWIVGTGCTDQIRDTVLHRLFLRAFCPRVSEQFLFPLQTELNQTKLLRLVHLSTLQRSVSEKESRKQQKKKSLKLCIFVKIGFFALIINFQEMLLCKELRFQFSSVHQDGPFEPSKTMMRI